MNIDRKITAFLACSSGARSYRPFIFTLTMLIAIAAAGSTISEAGSTNDQIARAEIRTLFDTVQDAWGNDDLEGFLALYDESPNTTFLTKGGIVRGYDAIRSMLLNDFGLGAGNADGRMEIRIAEFRMLSDQLAYVVMDYTIVLPGGDGSEMQAFASLVLRKAEHGWKAIADHAP